MRTTNCNKEIIDFTTLNEQIPKHMLFSSVDYAIIILYYYIRTEDVCTLYRLLKTHEAKCDL